MKRYLPEMLAVLLVILAFLALAHQHFGRGEGWFNYKEAKTHEAAAMVLVSGGIGIVIGKYLGKI
jgi:hypothetical protein